METRVWHEHYEDGVPASIDYDPLTVPGILDRTVERFGDRPAVIFRNRTLRYAELGEQVDRLATALTALGVGKGDRVAIHGPNLPHVVIGYFAAVRVGAIAVMTNPLYTARELEHQWNDAGCVAAITLDFLYEGRIREIRDRLRVQTYIVGSIPDYLAFPLNLLAPFKLRRNDPPLIARVEPAADVHLFRDLVDRTEAAPPDVDIELDDVAMLQYTGGTTGRSKGAMLTHRNISVNTQQVVAWNPAMEPGNEVCLGALPLFHIYGLTVAMLVSVCGGGALVLMPDPRDTPGMLQAIEKHQVTLFPGAPAMYNAIVNHPKAERADLSSVRVCNSGSAPLPVEVLRRFEGMTGARISEGYGLTEASPVTHSNPVRGQRKVGSIGVPVSDTDVRIVDLDDGTTEVPRGEEGELLVRGPQVMKGYWERDEETRETLQDGWLRTGDIARMDEEGYHYIVGRVKDMILASGYNIYPDEVDDVLSAHPAVLESATIGVPDEKRGETVKSFVVLRDGADATADELIAYCRENLAAYKIPRTIEFRDELPKSTVLKVLRRELREEELEKMGVQG